MGALSLKSREQWKIKYAILFYILLAIGIIGILGVLGGFVYLAESKLYAIAVILITLVITLLNKKLGSYLIVLSIPLLYFPQLVSRVNITSSEAVILTVLLTWFVLIIKNKQSIFRKTKLDIPLIIFLILTFLSLIPTLLQMPSFDMNIDSSSPIFSVRLFLVTLISVAMYFYLTNNLEKNQVKNILLILIFSLLITSAIGIWQEAENPSAFFRVNSTFHATNEFGMYLILVIPLLFSLFFYYKDWKFIPILLITGISIIALLFTLSRGSWLGFFVAILFLVVYNFKHIIMNKKLFLVFALLFVIFLMLIYTTPLTKRLEFDSSTEARLKTWKNSGVIIKENPLIGVGIGSYQRSYQNITGEKLKGEHAHNQFLHIFAERGIVTGLLFIYIMVLLFISNWKLIKNSKRLLKYLALGLFAGFIAFFTQGMFEYLFFYSRNALFFWFLAALAIYLEDEDVKKID